MDLESRVRWEAYTKAKEVMLQRTHIPESPWWVIPAVEKQRARLNCIHHLLQQAPYQHTPREAVKLPKRIRSKGYRRYPNPQDMIIPQIY